MHDASRDLPAAYTSPLQTLVSRETSPLGSAVVSIPVFQTGDAHNVIPDSVRLEGTMRAMTIEHMDRLKHRIEYCSPLPPPTPHFVSIPECNHWKRAIRSLQALTVARILG